MSLLASPYRKPVNVGTVRPCLAANRSALNTRSVPQIYRTVGLEGPFRGHLVQPRCGEQGHLQLPTSTRLLPGVGHLPPLWVTWASVAPPSLPNNFFLRSLLNLSSSSLKSSPLELIHWNFRLCFRRKLQRYSGRKQLLSVFFFKLLKTNKLLSFHAYHVS